MNYIDLLIIIVLLFYAIEGVSLGFWLAILDLGSFIASFLIGLAFYSFFGSILIDTFSIPKGFSNAIGFFIAAFLAEIIINFLLKQYGKQFIPKISISSTLNRVTGGMASVLSGLVLVSFIATLIVSLPLSSFLKNSVSKSKIASFLTTNTQGLAKDLNNVFGGAVNESLSFLTVKPESSESVNLNFKTSEFRVSPEDEKKMFGLVNKERAQRGIRPVEWDERMAEVGRRHCEDMFRRGYFSHNSPEGLTPFDRMQNAGINFNFAGENLALAPNIELAHQGLMQSKGHRENILQANFGHLGVGAIDGGPYGIMFCQEFKD
jgi:uncharacterized protein YkwD